MYIKLKSLLPESFSHDFSDEYEKISDKMRDEWYSGQKHQSWRLVPKRLLELVWMKFIKYGRVDDRGLDKIWEIIRENIIKLTINSNIQSGNNLDIFDKEKYSDVSAEEWKRFANFISDRSGPKKYGRGGDMGVEDGFARYSDCHNGLTRLADKVDNATTSEEKLIAIDQILNFVHGIGGMAGWFVEGGWKSLMDLNDKDIKGIHLKGKLSERKLDTSKKEDAAEHLIRYAWKFVPAEDKYNADDLFLYIDNERELHELSWKLASQFYPTDEEAWYTFQKDVQVVLSKLEDEYLKKRKALTPSLKDPMYILKKLMVKSTWNQVKSRISKISLGGPTNYAVDDIDAEEIFNRLYRNTMGETEYDISNILKFGYGKISDLRYVPNTSAGNSHQYNINLFLNSYGMKNIPDKIKVWRGTNNPHALIRPGDFVTLDRGFAQNYQRGNWKAIITDILDTKDLILYKTDKGMSELVYWPEGYQIKKYDGVIPSLREFWEQHRFGI